MEYHVQRAPLKDPKSFFVCQIGQPENVESWIANIGDIDTAAKERHWCAMCCVRSLLLAEDLPAPSLEELFDAACRHGVYRADPEMGWRGAYHKELAEFVSGMTGTRAFAHRAMTTRHNHQGRLSLGQWIGFGHYILLSVHPDIRLTESPEPESKRGHFVLVYGFKAERGVEQFLLHNSTGFASNRSQAGVWVPSRRIDQMSCGDGVVVRSRFTHPRV
jgi:hypothetical protein